MAKKLTAASDDVALYDIAPAFQDKLAAWLVKKPHGVIVDIGATPEAFVITMDPGGKSTNASFEDALHDAMGSRSRTKYIDPELEAKVHEFLVAKNAHMTFGASKDGTFNVVLSNPDARGTGSDEDFEIALMLAEEEFWQNMPARPLPPGTRAALEHALKPREQRDEESHEALRRALLVPRPELDAGPALPAARQKRPAKKPQAVPAAAATSLGPSPSWFIPKAYRDDEAQAQLHKALMEPRAGLEANRQGYGEWAGGVESMLEARGYDFQDASVSYWRQLYQAGFGPHQAAEEFETAWLEQRGYAGNKKRPPPAPSSKPFDPAAPREHYAKSHHFAVNPSTYPQEPSGYVLRKASRWSPGRQLPYTGGEQAGVAPQVYGSWEAAKRDADRMRAINRVGFDVVAIDQSGFEIKPSGYTANMDPNAALRRYWEAVDEGDIAEARDAKGDLMNWLERGGFSRTGQRLATHVPSSWRSPVRRCAAGTARRKSDEGEPRRRDLPAAGSSVPGRRTMLNVPEGGSWRIRLAGNDIVPIEYRHAADAERYARHKYGPSGWTVEWHTGAA